MLSCCIVVAVMVLALVDMHEITFRFQSHLQCSLVRI